VLVDVVELVGDGVVEYFVVDFDLDVVEDFWVDVDVELYGFVVEVF